VLRALPFAAVRLLAIVLVLAALGGSAESHGATQPTLLIADAGAPPALAAGAARYFAAVNALGGVNGRPIVFRAATPAEDPLAALALEDTADPVPQLVVSGSAAARGKAWAVGYVPGYGLEARVLAGQIAKTNPGARIGVLTSDDADGRELASWLKRSIHVSLVSTSPEALRASGVDTLVVLASAPVSLPLRDWVVYSNAAAAAPVPGAISTTFVRPPSDPAWAADPARRRFQPANADQQLGLAAAFTLVDALRHAGSAPTRAAVLRALRRTVEANNPFLVPGTVVRGGIHQAALQRFAAGRWRVFTPPLGQ